MHQTIAKAYLTLTISILFTTGCHLQQKRVSIPTPSVPVPRELQKVSMPDYIIEPPDVLNIDVINLIPKAPYRLNPLDTVHISANEDLEPILDADYIIQPNGEIQLGFGYGTVHAAGETVRSLGDRVVEKLTKEFRQPDAWASLVQIASQQQVAGQHIVAPDGTVNLGVYGRVRVVGLNIEQAKGVIEEQLSSSIGDPQVSVNVLGFNSKVFYVITQGAGLGDGVTILPLKGNETVLDAIGQIEGLRSVSSARMWVARPSLLENCTPRVLPVDWLAITQDADARTNYQIMAGDRIYVAEDPLVAMDTLIGKLTAPIERVAGLTLLTTQAVQRLVYFDRFQGNVGF